MHPRGRRGDHTGLCVLDTRIQICRCRLCGQFQTVVVIAKQQLLLLLLLLRLLLLLLLELQLRLQLIELDTCGRVVAGIAGITGNATDNGRRNCDDAVAAVCTVVAEDHITGIGGHSSQGYIDIQHAIVAHLLLQQLHNERKYIS